MAAKRTTSPKPKYEPTDRVTTPRGPGMIIREVRNLYLMRPGFVYEVELDGGEKIEVNERDLTP